VLSWSRVCFEMVEWAEGFELPAEPIDTVKSGPGVSPVNHAQDTRGTFENLKLPR
jgi:hypothetical protein